MLMPLILITDALPAAISIVIEVDLDVFLEGLDIASSFQRTHGLLKGTNSRE